MKHILLIISCLLFHTAIFHAQGVDTEGNLALGKKTFESKTLGGSSAWAVDGNTDGNYQNHSVTHTTEHQGAYWQVDLGAVYDITTIQLFNRTDCCAERLDNYNILVTDDGNWNNATLFADHEPYSTETVRTFRGQRRGRWVRVRLNGTGYLSLAEVKVFSETTGEHYDGIGSPKIGQLHEGGIIFRVDEGGKSGLICHPYDQGPYDLKRTEEECLTQGRWQLPTGDELGEIVAAIGPGAVGANNNIGLFSNDPRTYYWSNQKSGIFSWSLNLPNNHWQYGSGPALYRGIKAFSLLNCCDGIKNQGEKRVDCGGPCNPCPEDIVRTYVRPLRGKWMRHNYDEIEDKLIRDICFPGTHNSGSYQLSNEIIPAATPLIKDLWRKKYAQKVGLRRYIKDMSLTQSHSFMNQLRKGIRYLDMRVCKIDGEYYTMHSLKGNLVSVLMSDLKIFLDEPGSKKEVVIIKVSLDDNNGSLRDLKDYLRPQLPNLYYDIDSTAAIRDTLLNFTKLSDCIADNHRALFMFNKAESTVKNYDAAITTNEGVLSSAQGLTEDFSSNDSTFLEIQFNRPVSEINYARGFGYRKRSTSLVAIAELALAMGPLLDILGVSNNPLEFLSVLRAFKEPTASSLQGHAEDSRSVIKDYFDPAKTDWGENKPNLIMCDFFEEVPLVEHAIALTLDKSASEVADIWPSWFGEGEVVLEQPKQGTEGPGRPLKATTRKYKVELNTIKVIGVGAESDNTLELAGAISVVPFTMDPRSDANEWLLNIDAEDYLTVKKGQPLEFSESKDFFCFPIYLPQGFTFLIKLEELDDCQNTKPATLEKTLSIRTENMDETFSGVGANRLYLDLLAAGETKIYSQLVSEKTSVGSKEVEVSFTVTRVE
jgi:hypothetical protein